MIYALTVDLIFGMCFYYNYIIIISLYMVSAATIVILDGTYFFSRTFKTHRGDSKCDVEV